ncbi:hypothetical protein CYY_002669 [Polysphondylium violaceum]|uniref:Carbohydrate binding domain-containing protein n=1 Tax=Polysphondylium violaceum TaxID=133409 RepID=A0A8J4PZR5_9MYCE|nr:hypothetical protein CYY_002669 [Polysphondylium violaceum]
MFLLILLLTGQLLFLSCLGQMHGYQQVKCVDFLTQFQNDRYCAMVSFTGVSRSLSIYSWKGHLQFSANDQSFVNINNIRGLDSNSVVCNKLDDNNNNNNITQPFSIDNISIINSFSISIEGTLTISTEYTNSILDLICFKGDFAFFQWNNINYILSISNYRECPKLEFGDSCSEDTTVPPINSQTNFNINFNIKIIQQWTNGGKTFYIYSVSLINNGNDSIDYIEISKIGFNPIEYWNIIILENKNYGLPIWVSQLGSGKSHTFGFISTQYPLDFKVVTIHKVITTTTRTTSINYF